MNEEKITVLHDNKFETVTLGKTRFFFNLPRKFFIPIFILLIILIPILIYLYTQSQKATFDPKPSIIPQSSSTPTPTPQLPSLETEGILNKLEGKQLILEKNDGSKEIFTLTDSTVFYKCTDFNNINSCTKDKNVSPSSTVKIYTKGKMIEFIQFK